MSTELRQVRKMTLFCSGLLRTLSIDRKPQANSCFAMKFATHAPIQYYMLELSKMTKTYTTD